MIQPHISKHYNSLLGHEQALCPSSLQILRILYRSRGWWHICIRRIEVVVLVLEVVVLGVTVGSGKADLWQVTFKFVALGTTVS